MYVTALPGVIVCVVELPDAQTFVPVKATFTLHLLKAETLAEAGKVIVIVNRDEVNEPELLMKKFLETPFETVLLYKMPRLVKV